MIFIRHIVYCFLHKHAINCIRCIRQAIQWTRCCCCCCCCCQGEIEWIWRLMKHLASWELSADGKFSTTQWSAQRAWFQRVFTCSPLTTSVKPTRYDLDLGYLKQEAPLPRRTQHVRFWYHLKAHNYATSYYWLIGLLIYVLSCTVNKLSLIIGKNFVSDKGVP